MFFAVPMPVPVPMPGLACGTTRVSLGDPHGVDQQSSRSVFGRQPFSGTGTGMGTGTDGDSHRQWRWLDDESERIGPAQVERLSQVGLRDPLAAAQVSDGARDAKHA